MAVAVALGACSNDSTSTAPAPDPVVGSYVLTTVNGQPLPATVNAEGFPQTFAKGTLSVTDTSYQLYACFQSASTTGVCGAGFDALTSIGSWTANGGGSYVFTDAIHGVSTTAALASGRLTIPYAGNSALTFGFSKS